MQSKLLTFAAMLFLLSILLFAGSMDYEDAVAEEIRYCTDVATWRVHQMTDKSTSHGHPDYKGIYDDVCRQYEPQDQFYD